MSHPPEPTTDHSPHSAILISGGRSSRMGQDKASLKIGNLFLWERQIAVLRSTFPTEIFISGRANGPYANQGFPILEDDTPNGGPLSGILAGLREAKSPFLLVLAIDLPEITESFLTKLLQTAQSGQYGVIPEYENWWHGLCAVYPKSLLPLAEECIRSQDLSIQNLVKLGIQSGFLRSHPITLEEQPLLRNVNSPEDLALLKQKLC